MNSAPPNAIEDPSPISEIASFIEETLLMVKYSLA